MRPDLRRDEDVARPGPAQSIGSRSARFSSRQFRSAAASSDRGVFCDLIAIAAAVPAAWPIAMHVAIERADAWASCVAEKQRPATSMPSTPSGSKHRDLEVLSRALVALPSSRKFQPLEKQRIDRDEEART